MRYIGSKGASLPMIHDVVEQYAPFAASICDPFAGTCTVARSFKARGFSVHTGDSLMISYLHQKVHIGLTEKPGPDDLGGRTLSDVLTLLNALEPHHGLVTEQYSCKGVAQRSFFTPENAMKLDAVLGWLKEESLSDRLTESGHSYLTLCAIEAMDRVANTAGTYYAYLKTFGRKSSKNIEIKPIEITNSDKGAAHSIEKCDARDVVRNSVCDVLYLDPPYNRRNYSAYYHLPESVALGEMSVPTGRSGVPKRPLIDSPFYHREKAASALNEIVRGTNAKVIIFHYTRDGIIEHDEAVSTLSEWGRTVWHDSDVRSYSSRAGAGGFRAGHRIYVSTRV